MLTVGYSSLLLTFIELTNRRHLHLFCEKLESYARGTRSLQNFLLKYLRVFESWTDKLKVKPSFVMRTRLLIMFCLIAVS